MGDLIGLAAVLGSLVTVGFITWTVGQSRERRAQIQAEVQSKLIERFATSSDFVAFLQSPDGREFVSGVKSAPILHARERAVSNLSRAFVLTAIGVAFIALWLIQSGEGLGMAVPGFILTALGLANLMGAIVSLRLLGKSENSNTQVANESF